MVDFVSSFGKFIWNLCPNVKLNLAEIKLSMRETIPCLILAHAKIFKTEVFKTCLIQKSQIP